LAGKVKSICEEKVVPVIEELGYDVVEVEYIKKSDGMNLTFYIDSDNGIQIEDCEPVCLKLFYLKNKYNYLCHGANFEVQTGLFLNTHSNDFVHMLFGKVSTKYAKDGFLVTQYLDSTKTPIKNDNLQTGYSINYVDDKEENFINGVIIDYGGARINKDFC